MLFLSKNDGTVKYARVHFYNIEWCTAFAFVPLRNVGKTLLQRGVSLL